MGYRLAASAEMLYRDLPFVERVERIRDQGFEVEIWDWTTKDLHALAATGATFSSMTGYLRGDLTSEEGTAELLATAEQSLRMAEIIDSPRLNLHGPTRKHRAISNQSKIIPFASLSLLLKRFREHYDLLRNWVPGSQKEQNIRASQAKTKK